MSLYFSEGNTYGWKCWLLGSCMFGFIRNCQIFSQAGGTILYSHQEWMRVLAPHPHKHLICPGFKPGSVSLQSIPAGLSACPWALASVSPLPWEHLFTSAWEAVCSSAILGLTWVNPFPGPQLPLWWALERGMFSFLPVVTLSCEPFESRSFLGFLFHLPFDTMELITFLSLTWKKIACIFLKSLNKIKFHFANKVEKKGGGDVIVTEHLLWITPQIQAPIQSLSPACSSSQWHFT